MSTSHIVVVSATARPLCYKGTDMLDGREGACSARCCSGRHRDVKRKATRRSKRSRKGGVVNSAVEGRNCYLNGGKIMGELCSGIRRMPRFISLRHATTRSEAVDTSAKKWSAARERASWGEYRNVGKAEPGVFAHRYYTESSAAHPLPPIMACGGRVCRYLLFLG
jgi:hypothetical protein